MNEVPGCVIDSKGTITVTLAVGATNSSTQKLVLFFFKEYRPITAELQFSYYFINSGISLHIFLFLRLVQRDVIIFTNPSARAG